MDLERELLYIHSRISANSRANHIAMMAVQSMLEVSLIDDGKTEKDQTHRMILSSMEQMVIESNEQINEMNAEFKDVIDATRKRGEMTGP